jgi:hypothetical protein
MLLMMPHPHENHYCTLVLVLPLAEGSRVYHEALPPYSAES